MLLNFNSPNGQVIWITGLSAAGKTTVAKGLKRKLINLGLQPILLDGDELRAIFGNSFGYTQEARLELGMCYSRLCKGLSMQGQVIIIATIAMYDQIRIWNAINIPNYYEVYLEVPLEERQTRDPKGLYEKVKKGTLKNMPGIDMDFEKPKNPNITIKNYGNTSPEVSVKTILIDLMNKL